MTTRAIQGGGVMVTALALVAAVATAPLFKAVAANSPQPACPAGDTGITLSPGFCATVFADDLGHVRHMVVAPDGVLYVNTWSGRYYHNAPPPTGGFLIALRDTKGQGRADDVQRFGPGASQGAAGGTGIALYRNFIYAEISTANLSAEQPLPAWPDPVWPERPE